MAICHAFQPLAYVFKAVRCYEGKTVKTAFMLLPLAFLMGCSPQTAANSPAPSLKAASVATPVSHFETIDGVKLHYLEEGSPEKPTIIMLPGHMGDVNMYAGWMPALRDDYRIIRLDWPPYGQSIPDPSGVYSSKRAADLVLAFMDKMKIEKAILVGTSNGATVAALIASKVPDRVTRLALSTFPLGAPPKREISPNLIAQFKLHGTKAYRPQSYWRAILEDIFYDPANVTDEIVETYTKSNNIAGGYAAVDEYIRTNRALYDSGELPTLYAKITSPALIQWGDGGKVVPAYLAQGSVDVLVNAPVVLKRYPQSGHMPMLEEPELTGADLARFLRGEFDAEARPPAK